MTSALGRVAALVGRESGIKLEERQYSFLQAALDRTGPESEPEAFLRRASDPIAGRHLITRLIEEITIKETSFLRDPGQLATIDWRVLLGHARARGADQARIWTAACATGEEAYSLAMLACAAFGAAPPVSILATDISADALDRARRGVYRPRSVRGLDPAMRRRYFRETSDGLAVGEELRSLATFARHNLISDCFPPAGQPAFDLIVCRNLFIYFDAETVARVLECFQSALAPAGRLVLGAADVLCATQSRLTRAPADALVPRGRPEAPSRRLRRPLGRLPAVGRVAGPVPSSAGSDPLNGDAITADASCLISKDSPDALGYFQRGLAELEAQDPMSAVQSLRRALFVEPRFGLAAFKLGGAHEALGDLPAARRAYERTLRVLQPDDRQESLLGQIDLADIARATRARLDLIG